MEERGDPPVPANRRHVNVLPPECLRVLEGDPAERIPIIVSYHNGFPRYHTVPRGFLQRLTQFLKHSKFDMVWYPAPTYLYRDRWHYEKRIRDLAELIRNFRSWTSRLAWSERS